MKKLGKFLFKFCFVFVLLACVIFHTSPKITRARGQWSRGADNYYEGAWPVTSTILTVQSVPDLHRFMPCGRLAD